MRQLRDYQESAVNKIRTEWSRGIVRTVIVHSTGLGKTDIIAKLATDEAAVGGRVLLLAHRSEPLDQMTQRCLTYAPHIPVGRVQADLNETSCAITAASVQTVSHDKRLNQLLRPTLVIIDECHHGLSQSYIKILNWAGSFETTRTLGVTATLVRGDGRGFGELFETVADSKGIDWAVRHRWLVPPRGKAVLLRNLDLQAMTVRHGDYADSELGPVIDAGSEAIVKAWQNNAGDRITVAFTPTIASARALCAGFTAQGVPAEVVLGSTARDNRKAIYARLAAGQTRVLVSVMVTTEAWDCLDSKTEILTTSGWRGIGQVTTGDVVQSLNRKTGLLEPVPATRYVERLINPGERMFTAVSQHVNIRTSERHEFHVRTRHSPELKTITGTDLAQRQAPYMLPLAAPSTEPFKGLDLTDDEIRFIAWFMTDGGFSGYRVEISQSKHYKNEIRALLTRLGLDFTERVRKIRIGTYPNAKPLHVFGIPKGTHSGSLQRSGWDRFTEYLDKNVANIMHQMTKEQFLIFWEEMLKGDGDRCWLTCDRQSQVDAYTMMATVRGLSASYRIRTSSSGVSWFRVAIRDKQWIISDPSDARSAQLRLENPRDGERVWCVTNRNSTLVTRRHGKIVIIGNCPPVSCVLMARPTALPGLYQQMMGRGLRLADGKIDCLVLDVVGVSRGQKLVTLVNMVPSALYDDSEIRPRRRRSAVVRPRIVQRVRDWLFGERSPRNYQNTKDWR